MVTIFNNVANKANYSLTGGNKCNLKIVIKKFVTLFVHETMLKKELPLRVNKQENIST